MSRRVLPYSVMALLLTVMFWSVASPVAAAEQTSSYLPHDPITIWGNAGFTPANGVVRGIGTATDPFIIEGWEIASLTSNGLEIRNTEVYFVIQDCYIHGDGSYHTAIYLDSCSHGTIANCTCSNNGNGIWLVHSDNSTVVNNNCYSNKWCGIVFYYSDDNRLVSNTCSNNYNQGILLTLTSDNNTIRDNTCWNNGDGIYLGVSSDNNALSNNNCSSNGRNGICNWMSSNNTLSDNTCSSNGWFGMQVYWSSDNNTLINNTCSSNRQCGILLSTSDDNTLSNNTCSSNTYGGIFIELSRDNAICNNTCSSNNVLDGIRLDSSSDNTICNNTCSSNGEDGIVLWIWSGGSSSGNTICNNTCSNNVLVGIELVSSSDNTLSNNTCSHNGDEGIWLDSSSSNTLDNNSCMSNYLDGIGIGSSSDNILSDNNCSSNGEQGIWLGIWYGLGNSPGSLSNNNKIARNQLCGNSGYGVYIDSGSNNRVWNNTFCNNNGAKEVYDRRHVQAFDSGTGNWWNSSDGYGNNWGDWRGPDVAPADGIVDYPYHIAGAAHSCDYYPLATSSPDPSAMIDALIKEIKSWGLPKGTTTGLTSKLSDAMELLKKGNVNGALHNLMEFVSIVHALEGKQLTLAQAHYALTSAETIMDLLK